MSEQRWTLEASVTKDEKLLCMNMIGQPSIKTKTDQRQNLFESYPLQDKMVYTLCTKFPHGQVKYCVLD